MEEQKNSSIVETDREENKLYKGSNIYLKIGFTFLLVLILSLLFMEVILPIFNLFFGSNGDTLYPFYLLLILVLTLFFIIFGLVKKTGRGNNTADSKLAVYMIVLLAIFFILVIGMIIAFSLGDG